MDINAELEAVAREIEADKWKSMPKGWTDESRKKFWDTLTGRAPKHKVTRCIKEMTGKVSDPGAFCAALADRVLGTTDWRGKKAANRTFMVYGDEYPDDSKYAKVMAQVLSPPGDSDYPEDTRVWDAVRDWATKTRISDDDMDALLMAIDSGDANAVLRGPIKSVKDVGEVADRLGLVASVTDRTAARELLMVAKEMIALRLLGRVESI